MPPGSPVVVLANAPWASQWRRKQQLYSRLARRRPVYYLDSPSSLLDFGRGHLSLRKWLAEPYAVEEDSSGVRIVRGMPGIPAARFSGTVQRLNAVLHRSWTRECLRRLKRTAGVKRPILICYEPMLYPLVGRLEARQVIYDAIDDYAAQCLHPRLAPVLRRKMNGLAGQSDLTIAVNESLRDRLADHARRIELLPHGVDTTSFTPTADRGTRFAALRELQGIKAVYHGTLSHRLDLGILEEILRSGIVLLLAGVQEWKEAVMERLRAAGDLRYFGLLSLQEDAGLVAAADVGILPYRTLPGVATALTVKRLEYYAAGIPVVASDTEAFRGCAAEIRIAGDASAFVGAVQAAAAAPDVGRRQRMTIAAENTWDAHVAQLDTWLEP